MTWQRIDENTYIDDTLVTCAEYQLFIDVMRGQGKNYQPDHWASYQFETGHAREPILGVRHSDAVVFCEWLTSQEDREWKFRLPTMKEASDFPINPIGMNPLGYWGETEDQFAWVGTTPSNARAISRQYEVDYEFTPALNYAKAQSSNHPLTINLTSDLHRAIVLVHDRVEGLIIDLSTDRYNAKSIDHNPSRAQAIDQAHSRTKELFHALGQAYDLDVNPDRTIDHTHNFDHDLVCARNLVRVLDYANELANNQSLSPGRISIFEYVQSLIQKYGFNAQVFIDLVTLRERITGRSPAFEGIRLVKERK